MQIDDNLNFAFPVRARQTEKKKEEKTTLIWGYHTPISDDVYRANWRIISETKSKIFNKGFAYAKNEGPNIAALLIRDVGRKDAAEWETEDLAPAFLEELKRLTHILAPGKNGFEMLPIDLAISRNVIDAREWNAAESSLVFFTCYYAMEPYWGQRELAVNLASVLKGSITSLPPMEFLASLPTSTPDGTSEAKET